jgi:hypothetical protein
MPCCAIAAALIGQPVMLWAALRAKIFGLPSMAQARIALRFSPALLALASAEVVLGGSGILGVWALRSDQARAVLPHAFHLCSVFLR